VSIVYKVTEYVLSSSSQQQQQRGAGAAAEGGAATDVSPVTTTAVTSYMCGEVIAQSEQRGLGVSETICEERQRRRNKSESSSSNSSRRPRSWCVTSA
jgi:hypothetical protein